MGIFETIVTYITDKERRLSTKTYVSIICIALIVILDNIVGLSYHYSVDKKLNEIQLAGQILKDTTLEENTRKEILALRQEVLNKKYFYDYITNGVKSLYTKEYSTKEAKIPSNVIVAPRNNLWFLISSTGIYLILYLILIVIFPFLDKSNSIGQKIAIEIIIIVLGGLNCAINYWLLNFIPKLGDTWTANYIVNFIIQVILFSMIMALLANEQKKKVKNLTK